jgi:hypothetical protein
VTTIVSILLGAAGSILAVAILAVAARGRALSRGWFVTSREAVRLRQDNARLRRELLLNADYLRHIRDVGQSLARAHGESADEIAERVRRHALEPIRGYVPTEAGEQLKIVWFRPDDTGELFMFRQVGHAEDVERKLRIPAGEGVAGYALQHAETVALGDMAGDPRFTHLAGGENTGAIVCAAIIGADDNPDGVLSVHSPRNDAFGDAEVRYVEALAGCVATVGPLLRPPA